MSVQRPTLEWEKVEIYCTSSTISSALKLHDRLRKPGSNNDVYEVRYFHYDEDVRLFSNLNKQLTRERPFLNQSQPLLSNDFRPLFLVAFFEGEK